MKSWHSTGKVGFCIVSPNPDSALPSRIYLTTDYLRYLLIYSLQPRYARIRYQNRAPSINSTPSSCATGVQHIEIYSLEDENMSETPVEGIMVLRSSYQVLSYPSCLSITLEWELACRYSFRSLVVCDVVVELSSLVQQNLPLAESQPSCRLGSWRLLPKSASFTFTQNSSLQVNQ